MPLNLDFSLASGVTANETGYSEYLGRVEAIGENVTRIALMPDWPSTPRDDGKRVCVPTALVAKAGLSEGQLARIREKVYPRRSPAYEIEAFFSDTQAALFLRAVARRDHREVGQMLCTSPMLVHVSEITDARFTPLHRAARLDDVELVRFLIRRGAHVDARDAAGNTPLHVAVAQGFTGTAKALVQVGRADPDAENKKGYTPLVLAAMTGDSTMAVLLLQLGATPDKVVNIPEHGKIGTRILATSRGDVKMNSVFLAASEGMLGKPAIARGPARKGAPGPSS